MIALELGRDGRVLIRPSGTEPKLKIYVDLGVELGRTETPAAREEQALGAARQIAEQVVQGLGLAD